MTTMTTQKLAAPRALPRLGGLSTTLVTLEVRRTLRNRRILIFTLVMPPLLFLMFGVQQKASAVAGANAAAYVLLSLAVYGAMVSATSAGAAVGTERAQGWSRQLQLTPLRPAAYVAAKVVSALVLALVSVAAELVTGAVTGVSMTPQQWILGGLAAWLGALVFAAFGLFVGYLLPTENAMQVVGPLMAILAMLGGLFVPLELLPHAVQTVAHATPVYGISTIARSPLTHEHITAGMVANVLVWGAAFTSGAVRLLRRDTARM
jgi:ABC-2 type transport system permease protein